MQAEFKGDLTNSPLAAALLKGNVNIKITGIPRCVRILIYKGFFWGQMCVYSRCLAEVHRHHQNIWSFLVCVCMNVDVYIHMQIYICTYTYTREYACTYARKHIHMPTCRMVDDDSEIYMYGIYISYTHACVLIHACTCMQCGEW